MTDIRRKLKVHHKDVIIDGEVMYLRLLAVNARKRFQKLEAAST